MSEQDDLRSLLAEVWGRGPANRDDEDPYEFSEDVALTKIEALFQKLEAELDRYILAHSRALTAQMKAEAEVIRLREELAQAEARNVSLAAQIEQLLTAL